MTTKRERDYVWFVECFDARGGIAGSPMSGHIGASVYWANQSAFGTLEQAIRCAKTCKRDGVAVAIKRVKVL